MAKQKKNEKKVRSKSELDKKLSPLVKLIFAASYQLTPKKNLKTAKERTEHKKLFMESVESKYRQAMENKRYERMEKRVMKNKHTRKSMEKFNELFPPPPETKDVENMSSEEFYDYLLNYQTANESYLDFLFDYITTAYLEGDLTSKDIARIVNAPSAVEIKKYIDSRLTDLKYKYSLAEEILNYSEKDQGSQLLKELMPDQEKESKNKTNKDKYRVKTIENMKNLLRNNFPDIENMKKELEKAKMIKSERDRLAKQKKMILANSPEALDLVKSKDGYASQKNQKKVTDKFIGEESKKEEQKKLILRKAKKPMTPSELISEKKKMMNQINQSKKPISGLDLKT